MKAKYIIIGLIAVLVIMQFFTIDKSKPQSEPSSDFIFIHQPNEKIASLITGACYDCHSYETEYPWYSNVAPVSWWLQDHIEEGREHLNFSTWAEYDAKKADHKLEEAAEEVEEGEMPLKSYTWMHEPSNLSDEEKELLVSYFTELRSTYSVSSESEEQSGDSHEDHEH